MLYLAEIQKQSKKFMGGMETTLKLIACQRNDRSWSVVGNESITTEDADNFSEGALVAIDLGTNRQIQGKIEPASQTIISVLKNFSRLLEKTEEQEQEIGQWKESLAIQSEDLSQRQLEMETRLEQVEQMEEEFKHFEQQKEEIAIAKAETERIKAEFEAKSAELQGAWEQLRGQQQNLEEQLKQAKILDEAQAKEIEQQLEILAAVDSSTNSLQDGLHAVESSIENQQQILQPHWQSLTQSLADIQTKQQELDSIAAELSEKKQQVESLAAEIEQTQQQLNIEQKSLEIKQELTGFLNLQLESQDFMLQMLTSSESGSDLQSKVDLEELENLPLPSLEQRVESLKRDLEKVARFVSDQEEELDWQCKAVAELEAKIAEMGEFERFTLEQELADEREAKKMLNQTLVGQRRSLKERHQVLLQHSRVLKRRQGIIDFDLEASIEAIDLTPIKQGMVEQQQKLQHQQQELDVEIARIEQSISDLSAKLERQKTEKSELESLINQQQSTWQELNFDIRQIQSQIDFYQQQLQPLQDGLDAVGSQVSHLQQSLAAQAEKPSQALDKMKSIIAELTVA